MSKTKEEILEQCYKNHKARIGYPENVFKAMQLYADQCVRERDAEILEWIDENQYEEFIVGSRDPQINANDLKQFIEQSKTKQP